jgi:PST family polysaccharide transporter
MRSATLSPSLSSRSFHALKWNYLGSAIRAGSQFVVGIILARLLGPQAFGTVAIGWLLVSVGMLVADGGFSAALIQREHLPERDIRFVSTVQIAVGAFFSISSFLLAGLVARFFHRPDAVPFLRAMSLLFVLQSFGQTPLALLRRSLDFRAAQRVNIVSYVAGYVLVGIPSAVFGCGTWSLVFAQLVQSGSSSILATRWSGASMHPTLRPVSKELFSFGAKVVGANLASWGIANLDSFVVGRTLGVAQLGIYGRAMTLVATPTASLTNGAQGILLASCSRAQADVLALRRAFLAVAAVIALACLPVFATVALVSHTVVAAVYGSSWLSAGPVLAPLALAMPAYALLSMVGPVLTAMNRVATELRVQLVTVALMCPVLLLASRYSLATVAWGMLGVYMVRCALLVHALLGAIKGRWLDLLRVVAWPTLCAIAVAAVTWRIDGSLGRLSPAIRLCADVAAAAAVLGIVGLLLAKRLLDGPHGEFLSAEGRLPESMRRWVLGLRGVP